MVNIYFYFRISASGVKTVGSRQSSRNSSVSGASKGSLPPSRTPSRPPSRPASRTPSRAATPPPPGSRDPSPENEDSLSELPPPPKKVEKKSRFSVIGIDASSAAQSKYGKSKERLNINRNAREKSPVVSFAEEVFDFEERQYQTVHAGCEIPKVNTFRERARSGRFTRDKRRSSQTGSRPSIIGWLSNKKRSTSTTISPKPVSPLIKDDGVAPDENENKEAANKDPTLSPKSRPRSKSDRFTRPSKKPFVAEVYKQVNDLNIHLDYRIQRYIEVPLIFSIVQFCII